MSDDRVDKLSTELENLRNQFSEQMQSVQEQLQTLQTQLEATSKSTPLPQPSRRTTTNRKKDVKPPDWDQAMKVWLPRIFMVVLLIGVIFGFIAAVKAGYLTEPVRCVIGYVAGIGFVVLGEIQARAKRMPLGQALIAGGISTMMLSTFAANSLYRLIPSVPAFIIDMALIAMSLYFSLRHKSQALATLSSFAAVLVPFLVHSTHPNTAFFVSYELLSSLTFLYYAARKQYGVLYFVSIAFLYLALFFAILLRQGHLPKLDYWLMGWSVLISHIAIFTTHILTGKGAKRTQIALFSSFALTTFCWSTLFRLDQNTTWLFFGLAVFYVAMSAWGQMRKQQVVVYSSIASFAIMLLLNKTLNGANVAVAYLVDGSVALLWGTYLRSRIQLLVGAFIFVVGIILTVTHTLTAFWSTYTAAWVLLLISLAVFRKYMYMPAVNVVLYWLETLLTLVFVTDLAQLLTQNRSIDTSHLTVSFAWMLDAILMTIYGVIRNRKQVRLTGVGLLFVTLAKLIIVDIPSVSIFVRAILFIGLGTVGIFISRFFYRKP